MSLPAAVRAYLDRGTSQAAVSMELRNRGSVQLCRPAGANRSTVRLSFAGSGMYLQLALLCAPAASDCPVSFTPGIAGMPQCPSRPKRWRIAAPRIRNNINGLLEGNPPPWQPAHKSSLSSSCGLHMMHLREMASKPFVFASSHS
jgi:hypothetical protein